MATTWTIAIDWDRDGEFSGDDIVTDRAVWVNWFLGFRAPYVDIAENSVLGLVLDNPDRRFSPENEDTANPLAGKIQPLRPVRVTSNDGTTTRTHWSGWVESVHSAANKYGDKLVKILCTGALQFLSSAQTKIELQENQHSDQHHRYAGQRGHLPAGAERCLGSWRRARRRIGARAKQRSCGITVIR